MIEVKSLDECGKVENDKLRLYCEVIFKSISKPDYNPDDDGYVVIIEGNGDTEALPQERRWEDIFFDNGVFEVITLRDNQCAMSHVFLEDTVSKLDKDIQFAIDQYITDRHQGKVRV